MLLYNIRRYFRKDCFFKKMSTNRTVNNRNKNRSRKGKPRYDRIIGALAIFIVLIILLVSCCKSCGGDDKDSGDSSSIVPTEANQDKNDNENSNGSDIESPSSALDNYTTITESPGEIYNGDLVVVNKQHQYTFPVSEEDSPIPIYEQKSDSYQISDYETSLKSQAITALNNLMDEFYAQTGHGDTMIISAYRTKEYQDEISGSGTTDIKGGYSDYHTGLSFNLGIFPEGENSYYYTPEGDYSWIAENCSKYGYITRYPNDKESQTGMEASTSQFRYVGIPHAIYMYENNMCLEEYIEFIKSYTYNTEHLKVAGPDKNYEIYYAAADPSADTEIYVPSDKTYTISGNNIDGFIITVELS